MPWFVKLEEGVVDRARFDRFLPDHLTWVRELERLGHHPSTGYWRESLGRNGSGAGGMLLFQAHDFAEAEAIVRGDPLIASGCVSWILHEWRVVAGELGRGRTPNGEPKSKPDSKLEPDAEQKS
ncbi:hypothetical protein KQ302_09215 [Synechococcus sp. CS-602]|uniref:YciI family protein n=1 Tax=Synechococcaceae TaxID=1890426 RepID=UPI0008FF3B8F|nr:MULTISPECIES: YciI family protein [Synechococcaceae]MCT4363437.1 YciI family protein [Candidatus Regnicoccus frigidus MAG-AL1]APD48483.1 hypothetical protein BM449_09890 [Synechococcus sp. SynAce01]MCT0205271.1 hypothetical protein [Synechococcus sp. CS-602]MCT0246765.1 hypothetical protein [Synechococcus sp. CS-601]MCT4367932.1 YciI family protein [Candidatus Regnicoccus frigidus MAG-AL2]